MPFIGQGRNIFRAGQTTDENKAYAHCMLLTKVYIHTLSGYAILIVLHWNYDCKKAPQCYIVLIFLSSLYM